MFDVEYSQKKESLFKILDSLPSKGFMPIAKDEKSYDDNFSIKLKNTIDEDKIFISVCGQIKAGKSSFLNYFLFKGEKTLPEASTPETAKLAKIQYGEKNKAIVHFYTTDEWNNLINEKIEDTEETFFEKYLKEDINNCAMQGIYPDSCLNKSKELSELSELSEFSSKNGKYQPFVSYIDIFINNDSLKDIVFVDTPGINDPNPVRTRITTKWVNQSTAIIYLMYSQQALGAPDIEFIDRYLSHIPSNRILFCLTKADTLDSNDNIKNFVQRNLRELPALKDRHFITNNEVYPISTLAAILKKKNDDGTILSEDDTFHYNRIMDYYPDCYNKKGFVDEFINEINSSLMKNKGAMLLEQIINNIKDICNLKVETLNREIVILKNDIAGSLMSNKELEEEIEKIKNKQEVISNNFKNEYEPKFIIQSDKTKGKVSETYREKENNIKVKISKWINQQEKFSKIKEFTLWELKDIIYKTKLYDHNFSDNLIQENFDDLIKEIIEISKKEISEIKGFKLYMSDTYLLGYDTIQKSIENVIQSEIEKGLNDCKVSKWIFGTNLEESKTKVIARIFPIINRIVNEIIEKFSQKINNFKINKLKELSGYFDSDLKALQIQISELEKKKNDKTININAIEESIKSLDEQKSNLEKEKEIIFNKMKALQ